MTTWGLQADIIKNPGKNVQLFVPGKTKMSVGDIFLGGEGTGVTDDQIGQAQRIYGTTADDTAAAYSNYQKGQDSTANDTAAQMRAVIAANAAPRADASMGMPTLARQNMEAGQVQNAITNAFNDKQFNQNTAQKQWENGITRADLMGSFEGEKTLAQKAQEIQDAQYKAGLAQDESQFSRNLGQDESQFGRTLNYNYSNSSANRAIDQQRANYDTGVSIGGGPSTSQYASSINKYAEQFGVSPSLIDAVIGQESGGQNGLTSSAGAYGIMQLMPETARSLGVTDSNDPDQNIMGGVKYLSQQLAKYGSNELALAAYNAGPGAVDNAISRAGSRDWSSVSRYLPSETQNYVPSILSNVKTTPAKKLTPAQVNDQNTASAYTDIQKALDGGASPETVKQNILSHSSDYERIGLNVSTLVSHVDLITKSWGEDGVNPATVPSDYSNASSAWNSLNGMWNK